MDSFVSDPQHAKFVLWILMGCISLVGSLMLVIGYLWKQNEGLKYKRQMDVIVVIRESIDNLSETISTATKRFEDTVDRVWDYVGDIDNQVSWLVGQHEANHKLKAPERKRRKEDHSGRE